MKRTVPFVALVLAVACATGSAVREVPPPMPAVPSAYEAAAAIELPKTEPQELPGLHHVYRLSANIVSGAEPSGDASFQTMAELGIRTILSVDGKEPDHETAARHGIRYVHIPIRYSGIRQDELLEIAKTFRELPGPFYVHCFHGEHRGPAAAAVGRLVVDGAPRDRAIAEMRQWCGTSSKYEGLYEVIAFGEIPSAAETRSFAFDFPSAHRFAGFRHAMIDITRSFDTIQDQSKREWTPGPSHPDGNARNEAAKMLEAFSQAEQMEEVRARPEDFRSWVDDCTTGSRALVDALARFEGGETAASEEAKALVKSLKATCSSCHAKYRDD